jgi:transposase
MSGHKPYPQEFKLEAVKLVTDQGLTPHKVARDLGVDPQTLRRWLRELAPPSDQPSAAAPSATAELARLRREVEQLRQERDILKKAIGIFSRMPQ